jgi:hypothetical protein
MIIAPGLDYDNGLGFMDYWIAGLMGFDLSPIHPIIQSPNHQINKFKSGA